MRKAAFTKLKGEQNRNYGINAQFPRENNEKRKKMKKNVVPVGFYHKIWFICLIRNPFLKIKSFIHEFRVISY